MAHHQTGLFHRVFQPSNPLTKPSTISSPDLTAANEAKEINQQREERKTAGRRTPPYGPYGAPPDIYSTPVRTSEQT